MSGWLSHLYAAAHHPLTALGLGGGPHVALAQGASAAKDAGISSVIAPYMGVFFVAFFVAIVVTPLMRRLAAVNGIVDWPDHKRKKHLQPVAYLGGVAIFLGWLAGVATGFFTTGHAANPDAGFAANYVHFPPYVVLGAVAILLTGLFDDVYGIQARVKVGGQLFAAAALASVRFTDSGQAIGVQLTQSCVRVLGLPHMPYWVIYGAGTVLIAVFVVGGCNALNLLDGLDGLAAGTTVIANLGFLALVALVAMRHQNNSADSHFQLFSDPVRLVMCLAVLGTLLGFLPYNFNPATIFMGDAGSLLLGYLSVTTMLLFADTGPHALLLVTACLIIFALPITDTSLAIFRRKMRGQALLAPDSQHIHHLLRRRGLSVKQSVIVMYLLAIGFAVVGCTLVVFEVRWRYILAVFFVMYGFIMVMAYKYGQHQHLLDLKHAAEDAPPNGPSASPNGHTAPTPRADLPQQDHVA